jgi:hypothetical protein
VGALGWLWRLFKSTLPLLLLLLLLPMPLSLALCLLRGGRPLAALQGGR